MGEGAEDEREARLGAVAGLVGACAVGLATRTLAADFGPDFLPPPWPRAIDGASLVLLWVALLLLWRGQSISGFRARRATQAFRELDSRRSENVRLRKMFEVTFESAAVGIAHVDLEGKWLRTNRWLCDMLGYTHEELEARTFQEITHPEDLEQDLGLLRETLDGQRDTYRMEKRYIHKDGQVVWGMLHVALVRNEAGAPAYFVSVISDLSHRKRLEARLEEHAADLTRANQNLEAFTYSVSHDLRAPLRAILGFSEVLLEDHGDALDDEARRVIGIVRRNASNMGGMIDSLLTSARLGRRPLEMETLAMGPLVEEAFALAREASPTQQVELHIGPLPEVTGDRELLRQVWANLATNALKYSRDREVSEIHVRATRDGGETVFSVRDNGVGFDPAYGPDMFRMFHRLHEAKRFEGHGVGLAIVEGVVQRHGGRVWAEGQPDAGATFFFTLPHRN